MRCDELYERIGDRQTGDLDERGLAALDAHLAGCPGCTAEAGALEALWRDLGDAEPVPSTRLRARFERLLEREATGAAASSVAPRTSGLAPIATGRRDRESRALSRSPGRSRAALAVAAAIVAALGVGVYLGGSATARRGDEELAALREEIRALRTTVALALLAEPSASERLSGVAHGRALLGADDRVAEALFATFLEDPNVNLRLAALDALRERASSPEVRARLVEAIPAQDSPLVQLSAIDVLFDAADSGGARADALRLAGEPALDAVVAGYLRDRLARSR